MCRKPVRHFICLIETCLTSHCWILCVSGWEEPWYLLKFQYIKLGLRIMRLINYSILFSDFLLTIQTTSFFHLIYSWFLETFLLKPFCYSSPVFPSKPTTRNPKPITPYQKSFWQVFAVKESNEGHLAGWLITSLSIQFAVKINYHSADILCGFQVKKQFVVSWWFSGWIWK